MLQDALSWYTFDAADIIAKSAISKRKFEFDDGGSFSTYQELMHSWVAYELVKVLLNFGLTPKICEDLNGWSLDLYCLFSYVGVKKRDASKKERSDEPLSILFDKTLHNSYFGKLPFKSKEKFSKTINTILPLVILTWLHQLQEYFYEIVDTNEHGD